MQFTPAQQATFKTWLTNNAASLSDQAAADLANTLVSGPYFVWQTSISKMTVDAQVNKANFTPADTPPTGTDLAYQNRALLCQLKQTNAQWLTQGQGSIDARITSVRQNFKDCLTAIPSGASGANQEAGWGTAGTPGAVRLAMMRGATNVEKLFVTAAASGPGNDGVSGNRGTNTNPDLLGIGLDGQALEGSVDAGKVAEARAS